VGERKFSSSDSTPKCQNKKTKLTWTMNLFRIYAHRIHSRKSQLHEELVDCVSTPRSFASVIETGVSWALR
jgi:hypothetical protein